ncbi:MAG: serine/threonine protein kinase [Myxococcales bacterium]|nr:serine/threonine protein kinase [Myxococcales bacterium]MCB9752027.1 serine/threonine protein kinase [Myxococcales bacterium]
MTQRQQAPRIADQVPGATIGEGPERVGSEQRWRARLPDGARAVLGSLLPELARDESLRRRYVHDVERLAALGRELDGGLARILASGPQPDPRDPEAPAPWRLREDPRGETLASWLERRAPAPIDEVAEIMGALAAVVQRVHEAGVVIRDLHPRHVVLPEDAARGPVLTDVGLARVDILSSRTAASLILEGSAYASPEQLLRTALDPRSDVFGLGVLLFQALTAELPFGDGPALLRADAEAPPVSRLRGDVPEDLSRIIARCLSADPEGRPESARELAEALAGERAGGERSLARTRCQSCGAALRVGQRLCLSCGKQAVVFPRARAGEGHFGINLVKATEDAAYMGRLRGFLEAVSDGPVPALNLIIGDARMYSKEEQSRRRALPLRLFNDLSEETAEQLVLRMRELEFQVKRVDTRQTGLTRKFKLGVATVIGLFSAVVIGLLATGAPLAMLVLALVVFGALAVGFTATRLNKARNHSRKPPFLSLRAAPAALPASDPLVARLAAALDPETPKDVREQLGELALQVQRLVDHREQMFKQSGSSEAAELARVSEPVEPLVALIEDHVMRLREVDAELAGLDEGAMVRALAASEARGEARAARAAVLEGLDRLRVLEDRRAALFQRLLEASNLLRRAVDLGLEVRDPAQEQARRVQLALRALDAGE